MGRGGIEIREKLIGPNAGIEPLGLAYDDVLLVLITRQVAGVGVPHFTAVMETRSEWPGRMTLRSQLTVIRKRGVVAKGIAAGASTVKLGTMLSGPNESPGFVILRNGRKMKVAREVWHPRRRLSAGRFRSRCPTGRPAAEVFQHLMAGLRSGVSYCDAEDIERMWGKVQFICQTKSGIREAGEE